MTAVTLITGARKGLGRFLAEHYASCGHQVIGCSRSVSDLERPNYRHFCLDVADEAAVRDMMSIVRREFGGLQNLINNAGIASMNHTLLTPASTMDKVFRTNVDGVFLLSREAAKLMRLKSYGRIVNFSTVAVPLNLEGEAAYVASKAAVEALTRVLAREFAQFGITVNTLGPSPIDTDLIAAVPSSKIEALLQRQAIKRRGTPSDVANVVDFFLREQSGFVTGQCIYLGGV